MDLSAEEFAEVLTAMGTVRVGAGDKRRANRVMHRCKTTITLGTNPDTDTPTPVAVKDFSPRGVGLLLGDSLPLGSQFVMFMPRLNNGPVRILCTVTNCRRASGALFIVGAEFTTLIGSPVLTGVEGPGKSTDVSRIRESILT